MDDTAHEGRCACGEIRYRVLSRPIIVHCCHCTWCQRETGSAFALNAVVEADRVVIENGAPELVVTPTLSGKGQRVWRCPKCRLALWSNYAGAGERINFVRVGTLLEPGRLPPDVHIFTSTKQPWVVLPAEAAAFAEFYEPAKVWSPDGLARFKVARSRPAT
jgi:hypothetical protein